MGALLGKGLKASAVGIGAGVGAALFKGFGRLQGIDEATAKLTGLGHSAEGVDKIMANALASVKGTAFGLDAAATTAAGAVAAGVKPGKALERTLSLVGDAATIAGTDMGTMGAIFNKVAASDMIQGDVLAQLGDAGIPVLQMLGKEMGVSATEVRKLASEGKINFATFQNAMETGLGGAAQESGKTFSGSLANIGAALGRLGANVLGGVFAKMPALFTDFGTKLDSVGPIAIRIGEILGTTFSTAGTVLGSVIGFVDRNRTAVTALAIAVGTLVAITKIHTAVMAVQAAGGLLAMLKGLSLVTTATKVYAAVQWVLNAALTANPIGLIVVGLVALGAGLVIAYKKSETFRKIVDAAFSGVKAVAMSMVSFFTKSVPAAFAKVQSSAASALGWVQGNWPKILAILTGPFGIAAALIIKNWDSIKAGGMRVLEFIAGIPNKITGVFAGAATLLYNAGVQLMSGLASGIANKIESAISAVQSGLSRIKGLLPGSPIKWGPLKNWNKGGAGKRLMDLVTLGITKGTPKTIEAAQTAFGKIGDALKSERSDLQSTLDGLKNDFASLADSVANAFTGDLFGVSATEAVSSLWGGVTTAGKTVGQNFIDNLLAKRGELTGLLSSFKTLVGWGLDPKFLSQMLASGNGALVTEIAGMGQAGALGTTGLFGEVNSLAAQLGNSVAANDPIASRIDETNAELRKANRQLAFLSKDIGKELNGVAAKAQRDKKSKKGKR